MRLVTHLQPYFTVLTTFTKLLFNTKTRPHMSSLDILYGAPQGSMVLFRYRSIIVCHLAHQNEVNGVGDVCRDLAHLEDMLRGDHAEAIVGGLEVV